MKTPEFYLDEVAEEVVSAYCMTLIKEAMRRYAEDACKEQREICADNAKGETITYKSLNEVKNATFGIADKESILNAPSPIKP